MITDVIDIFLYIIKSHCSMNVMHIKDFAIIYFGHNNSNIVT